MAGERDSAEEPLDEGAEVEGAREEPRDPRRGGRPPRGP